MDTMILKYLPPALACLLSVWLLVDAAARMRLGDEQWRGGVLWLRVVALAALEVTAGAGWCWPALVVEVLRVTEERAGQSPTEAPPAVMDAVRWGMWALSVSLLLAAAVVGLRTGVTQLWGVLHATI